MPTIEEAEKEISKYERERTEITDLIFKIKVDKIKVDHGGGEEHGINVLDRRTFFNFECSFSGMGIATATDLDEEIVRYHSPSVLVGAGLAFGIHVPDAPRAFKQLLQYFADLKTGFSVRRCV